MKSSKIHVEGRMPDPNEAIGYRFDQEKNMHVPDDEISLPVTAPDGLLVTTLNDFFKWVEIYKNNKQKILSQDSLQRMMTPAIKTGWGGPKGILDSMGYGLFLSDSIISHMREIVGFKSYFVLDKKNDVLVVIFSNNTTNDPIKIAVGLLEMLGYYNDL